MLESLGSAPSLPSLPGSPWATQRSGLRCWRAHQTPAHHRCVCVTRAVKVAVLFVCPAVNQLLSFTLLLLQPPSRVDHFSNTQAAGLCCGIFALPGARTLPN